MKYMNRLMGGTGLNEFGGQPRCCNLGAIHDTDPNCPPPIQKHVSAHIVEAMPRR